MVTFLKFNFLLFFILFFPLSFFFSSKYTILSSPFAFFFFFFPLCFSPPHTYSSYLIHPQPHLLTFNHFLFFYCFIFLCPFPSPFFNCSLFISLSKTQALVPLSPTKATPLGPPPCLYQPLVHGFFFFFGSKEKIAE